VPSSAPAAPASVATALYTPKPRVTLPSGAPVEASTTCSRVVNGPDSTTSVDSAPLNATSPRSHTGQPAATTTPAAESATYSSP
jgi:hypothetical protein